MRKKTQDLFEVNKEFRKQCKNSRFFGGSLLTGKRKAKRQILPKRYYHLVLRSEIAKGPRSMLLFATQLKSKIETQAKLHHVKIHDFANVGNHLHILIQPMSSLSYTPFIRAISGLIARVVLGVERGKALGIKFWENRPYTRLVNESRKSFGAVKNYFDINKCEAMGIRRERIIKEDPSALCFLELIKNGAPLGYS